MARSADERRAALLERITDYVAANGLSDLSLPRIAATYADTVRAAWKLMSAPEHERVFRLFFEVYGLALQAPERYAEFLRGAVDDWIGYLAATKLAEGYARREARAIATVLLAGYRGFLLDLLATRERTRVDRAVDLWIIALDAIPEPEQLADARRPRR